MRIGIVAAGVMSLFLSAALSGCGGGNGVGPKAIKQQEDKVLEKLVLDWENYNQGTYAASIESFKETLNQADRLEGSEGVQKRIKSEAYDGIGWSAFRQQDLELAADSFQRAVALDRQNSDAWVGWAGVSLAQRQYTNTVQFSISALEANGEYNSAVRTDTADRILAHDTIDVRHVRLMLAEAYFQLQYYSAAERADPLNAAAQMRLLRSSYTYHDPGQLLSALSQMAVDLQTESAGVF